MRLALEVDGEQARYWRLQTNKGKRGRKNNRQHVNASKGTQLNRKWLISVLPLAKQTQSRMSDEKKKKKKNNAKRSNNERRANRNSAPSGTVATVAATAAALDWRTGGGGGCVADGGGCASLSTRAALETT